MNGLYNTATDPQDPNDFLKNLLAQNETPVSPGPGLGNAPALPSAPPPSPTPSPSPVQGGNGFGEMLSQGLAGLGDAITGAYGTNKTDFLKSAIAAPEQAQKRQQMAMMLDKANREQGVADAQAKRYSDPSSPESLAAQEQAQKLGLFQGKDLSKMSFSQLSPLLGNQEKIVGLAQDKEKYTGEQKTKHEDAMARLAMTKAQQDSTNAFREANKDFAKQKFETADLEKLGKNTQGTGDVADALKQVEGKLGFDLNNVDKKALASGKIMVDGQGKEIPGMMARGVGWITAGSQQARNLKGSMDHLFNLDLHDRFGARITDAEMDRLKAEYQQGRFNTPADMVQALGDYKQAVGRTLARHEAAYNPETVKKYGERGGITSQNFLSPSTAVAGEGPNGGGNGGAVRRVTADGRTALFDPTTKKFLKYEGENK